MKKITKKIVFVSLFAFSFVLGASFIVKSYLLQEKDKEAKKPEGINESKDTQNPVVAQTEECDEEEDYLFVGCNGIF